MVSSTRRGYRLQNRPYFCVSRKRDQSNKRSGTRLKTESETGEKRVRLARFARVRLLRHALPISLLILRKKPTVLQSSVAIALEATCATISPYFKRLCNAICCVFKNHQLNSKNNDPVLLLETIFTVNPLFSPHS